jgi:hypothetical protein
MKEGPLICRYFGKKSGFRHQAEGRLFPNFFIFDCRVVLLLPRISEASPSTVSQAQDEIPSILIVE